MNEAVKATVQAGVGRLTLARPQGNAIDLETYSAINGALARMGADPLVRVIVIDAEGEDFSVGEDYEYLAALEARNDYAAWTGSYRGWIDALWHNPKLVVAEVRGRALGIGCELALLADVTFAAQGAFFGHPETARGIVPYTVWPWLVGPKLAKEYLATGKLMSATQAHRSGLINAALPDDGLSTHVSKFVADIVSMPDGTPGANKKRINWAFRDVSRMLQDDRHYDVDFDWLVASRSVDQSFYKTVAATDVKTALQRRDSDFR